MKNDVTDASLLRLAEQVAEAARAHRQTLVTAESCTGGWIAKMLTDIPGSSGWFECGMAAYSYEAKQALLGVRPQTLETHGAVSRETVIEMVSGALVHSGATLAVAVTGIAGPGGGTPTKPVGLVHFALSRRGGRSQTEHHVFAGDRRAVRQAAVETALRMLHSAAESASA